MWHLSSSNSIEYPERIVPYNMTKYSLLDIIKEDTLRLRTMQSYLEDNEYSLKNFINSNVSLSFDYILRFILITSLSISVI